MPRYVHVEPTGEGWAVKDGSSGSVGSFQTKEDAVRAGREIARSKNGEHIVHGRDGRIVERDSYGRDPFPPRAHR